MTTPTIGQTFGHLASSDSVAALVTEVKRTAEITERALATVHRASLGKYRDSPSTRRMVADATERANLGFAALRRLAALLPDACSRAQPEGWDAACEAAHVTAVRTRRNAR